MTVLYGNDVYVSKRQICRWSHHLIVTNFWGMGTITIVASRCRLRSAKTWEFVREIGVYWEVSAGFMKPTFGICAVQWIRDTKNMVLLILWSRI